MRAAAVRSLLPALVLLACGGLRPAYAADPAAPARPAGPQRRLHGRRPPAAGADHGALRDAVGHARLDAARRSTPTRTTPGLAIKAWRTPAQGPALWVLSGIHGEEPAGPNAIARNLDSLVRLAGEGVPIVLVPLANPNAYRHNWRYPNTPERDWKLGGGYSVGDSEYLLPDLETGTKPRGVGRLRPRDRRTDAVRAAAGAVSTRPGWCSTCTRTNSPPAGGYIYSQGTQPDGNPVGAEIVRLLQATGIPLRRSGQTRFGETIVDGVISRDDAGRPIRDGSIDELLAATEVFRDGRKVAGPAAHTVIVVETPAFEGSQFELRVAAQGAVVQHARELWWLSASESLRMPRPDRPRLRPPTSRSTVRQGWRLFLLLALLYFAQGLPSGLIAKALPALLREQGVSLSAIGFTSALALPWALKFLWAPVVDRYGTRRQWLLALNGLSLLLMLLVAARDFAAWVEVLPALLGLLFVHEHGLGDPGHRDRRLRGQHARSPSGAGSATASR